MKRLLIVLFALSVAFTCFASGRAETEQGMVSSYSMSNLEYWMDDATGICYAVISSQSYGSNYIVSFTVVPLDKIQASGSIIHHFSTRGYRK